MNHDLPFQSATYLEQVLRDPDSVIEWCATQLQDLKFDVLVGTGLSGCLVVPGVARQMGKKFALVRKDDGSHSHSRVEGHLGGRWVFLDDLIDSGSTLNRVFNRWQDVCARGSVLTEFVGALLYYSHNYYGPDRLNDRYGLGLDVSYSR